jgi:hypothetical protein
MDAIKIISVAGLSVIALRTYLSMRKNGSRTKLNAAEKLYEAFMDEIQDLALGKGDAYEILKKAFPKHEKAYLQFRPYLNGKGLHQFDEAWKEYCCPSGEDLQPFLERLFTAGTEIGATEKHQLALKKILRILSFTRKHSVLVPRSRSYHP